jgi:hypothetical protein
LLCDVVDREAVGNYLVDRSLGAVRVLISEKTGTVFFLEAKSNGTFWWPDFAALVIQQPRVTFPANFE